MPMTPEQIRKKLSLLRSDALRVDYLLRISKRGALLRPETQVAVSKLIDEKLPSAADELMRKGSSRALEALKEYERLSGKGKK